MFLVQAEAREPLALLDPSASVVPRVAQVRSLRLVAPEVKVFREAPALPDSLVPQDFRVQEEYKDHLVLWVRLVSRELLVPLASPDQAVRRVLLELGDLLVPPASPDLLVPLVEREFQVQLVLMDELDQREHPVLLVLPEVLDQADQLVLLVQLAYQEPQAIQVHVSIQVPPFLKKNRLRKRSNRPANNQQAIQAYNQTTDNKVK